MTDRAYAHLQIKRMADDERLIEGIATTPTADRAGDIVEPLGAQFKLPLPLLWQHNHDLPIGEVYEAKATKEGVRFKAQIFKAAQSETLRQRLDEAYESIKLGLVRAVSIGFRSLEFSRMEEGGLRFLKWEWVELSAVTIPANRDATIESIKSIDRDVRRSVSAGVSAQRESGSKKGDAMKVSELISSYEARMSNLEGQMQAIRERCLQEGRLIEGDDGDKFDELQEQYKNLAAAVQRARASEVVMAEKRATTVPRVSEFTRGDEGANARLPYGDAGRTTQNANIPKGIAFTRSVLCLAAANGMPELAINIAEKHYADDGRVAQVLKAAAPTGVTTSGSAFAAAAAEAQTSTSEFIEWMRPMSIIDRFGSDGLPAFRRVGFNEKIVRQTSGSSASWTGEAVAAPGTSAPMDNVTVGKTKVTGLTKLARELIRFGNINIEVRVRDDLARAVADQLNAKFVSADAAVANEAPAGMLNGLTAISPTGTGDADDVRADLQKLYAPFSAALLPASELVVLTNDQIHHGVSLMRSAVGVREFPDVTRAGGFLEFYPIIGNHLVGAGDVIMLHPPSILLADDGQVEVRTSQEASVTTNDGNGAVTQSAFQDDLVIIKVSRFINFVKGRSAAVAFIDTAAWGGAPSA